jgi:hypothetical protein
MKQVTKEEYTEVFRKQKLKPISSFTDIDGVMPFGYGCPAMDTDWGTIESDEPIARLEARKDGVEDKDWNYTYYLND